VVGKVPASRRAVELRSIPHPSTMKPSKDGPPGSWGVVQGGGLSTATGDAVV